MTFDEIHTGSAIFVDANIFVYYFEPHPVFGPPCQQLLQRIENKGIEGFTSAAVLSDVVHRIMTREAASLFSRPMTGIAGWLKQHPAEVQRLSRHRLAVDDLSLLGIDALVISIMQDHGLGLIASHDADFDRVPGLTRYAPV